MLTEVSKDYYRTYFTTDPSLYISEAFIGLVAHKADKIFRLMDDTDKSMGLILGLKDNMLISPFSAPFGGFHYSHEHISYDVVFNFIAALKDFLAQQGLKGITVTLPPDIYQLNMNAKLSNAFISLGFTLETPNITNHVNLLDFDGTWVKSSIGQNCRKAIRNQLSFHVADDEKSRQDVYDIIYMNRVQQNRKIYMTLDDILKVSEVIPVDFILIKGEEGERMGAGIFYRGNEKIVQAIFLGDLMDKRNLGVMDLLFMKVYERYKAMNFQYIDLGISSLDGTANAGLIRFKEIHNCVSTLRHTFSWSVDGF